MPPNILLLVLDSVRASNLAVHGYDRPTTPFLSQFASDSTLYTQARSPSITSVPSHISIFTGEPAENYHFGDDYRLTEQASIWSELSDKYGYSTAIFTDNPFFADNSYGLLDGFDRTFTYKTEIHEPPFSEALDPRGEIASRGKQNAIQQSLNDPSPIKSLFNGVWAEFAIDRNVKSRYIQADSLTSRLQNWVRPTNDYSADVFVNRFLDWQSEQSGKWAGFINLMDAHWPYVPQSNNDLWGTKMAWKFQREWAETNFHEEYFEDNDWWWKLDAIQDLYDGAIHQLDDAIKRLVNSLQERNVFEDTLLVITSDHGEAFGERSDMDNMTRQVGHYGFGISEFNTHVPLIVSHLGQKNGETVSELSSVSNFSQVVKSAISEDEDLRQFQEENHLLATARQTLREGDEHVEKFGFALYEPTVNSGIIKYVSWDGRGATVQIGKNDSTCIVESGIPEKKFESFNLMIEKPDTQRRGDLEEGISRDRLHDLGYL